MQVALSLKQKKKVNYEATRLYMNHGETFGSSVVVADVCALHGII
jgi:hypothetical protein